MLQITSVYINLNEDYTDDLLAKAAVTFNNCFMVKDIEIWKNKLYDGANSKYFTKFPVNKKHRSIAHPISEDLRQNIEINIINKYEYLRRKIDERLSGDYS